MKILGKILAFMRKNKLFLYIKISFLLFCTGNVFSQDIHFSQYYANPLYLNPAFAGTAICPRVSMNYRNQWPSFSGTYVSYSASYDKFFDKLSGGLGIIFNSDDAGEGALKTTIVGAMYSYKLPVTRLFSLNMALEASYFQKKLDWSKLTFNDMLSPKYGFVYNSKEKQPANLTKGALDFSAGIFGYGENIYGGAAVHHLTQPNEGFTIVSPLPMKLTFHLGGIINLEASKKRRRIEDPTLSPNILFMSQKDYKELNYGLYVNKYPLVGGIWFRQCFKNPDAFVILIGIQKSIFKVGYSYDVTVSKLSNASGGSHEISFGTQFKCTQKKKRNRAINCPSF
ncbi:MAG: type IX secretion system membrane protein PorP/SprF [Bacteroidetes bacterium]|nr:type IX secretion system membrane protein PorP/SprF [Bacteroidota bacterium]